MCVALDPSHMDQVGEGGEEGCVGSVPCALCVSGRPRWGGGLDRARLTASTVSRLSPKITTGVLGRMLGRRANAIAMAHCSEPPEVGEGDERQRT